LELKRNQLIKSNTWQVQSTPQNLIAAIKLRRINFFLLQRTTSWDARQIYSNEEVTQSAAHHQTAAALELPSPLTCQTRQKSIRFYNGRLG